MKKEFYKGLCFYTNDNGNLTDHSQFCKEWVEYNATKLRMHLTDTRWQILLTTDSLFKKNSQVPTVMAVADALKMQAGDVLREFPGGFKTILLLAGH